MYLNVTDGKNDPLVAFGRCLSIRRNLLGPTHADVIKTLVDVGVRVQLGPGIFLSAVSCAHVFPLSVSPQRAMNTHLKPDSAPSVLALKLELRLSWLRTQLTADPPYQDAREWCLALVVSRRTWILDAKLSSCLSLMGDLAVAYCDASRPSWVSTHPPYTVARTSCWCTWC